MTSAPRHSAGRVCDALALAVLALLAAIAALTFRDYGLGWDDYTHAEYGGLLLRLFESGFHDRRALTFVNLYAYGGGFDTLAAWLSSMLPFDLWETRRLTGALVGLAGLAVTWRIGRHLGGPLAGLIALVLLAACPLYYGHMWINPKDAPFAVAMAVLLLGLVRVLREYPAPSVSSAVILGLGLGLAFGTRILAGLSVIAAVLALAFLVVADRRQPQPLRRLGRFVAILLPTAVLAYAVMGLAWPWGVLEPLNPLRAFVYFSHFFEKPWKELFGGDLILVTQMPRIYLPQMLALKLPEVFLVLAIAGLVGALVTAARKDVAPGQRAALLVVALAALVPIGVVVATGPAMYNGIRHFVFVIPPLAVLGGWSGAAALEWLGARSRAATVLAAALFAAALASPVIEMVRLHPYQYTSFNHLAGGVRGADGRYMLDYWGLAFKQAAGELRARLAAQSQTPGANGRWRIAVCGPQRPAQVALGPQFAVGWDPKGADFAMALGEFYCAKLDAPIIAQIEREGVIYARVYDIRGKSITSLLAIPEP